MIDEPVDGVCFVAYVYPGWHPDTFRPGLNEWSLMQRFHPYFDGHERPPCPSHGPYDDSRTETAAAQIRLAADYGIDAFSYFTYYGPDGLVMSSPMTAALRAAEGKGFGIGATWCIRLPHSTFPVSRDEDRHTAPAADDPPNPRDGLGLLDNLPIEETTLRDLEELLGKAEASRLRLGSAGAPWLVPEGIAPSVAGDSRPQARRP